MKRQDLSRLSDLAYRQIVQAIYDGEFPPGARLKIEELSEQLDMSTTPVREALSRAVALDLVQAQRNRTYTVTPELDTNGVRELYVARNVIELTAIRHAEPTPEQVAELRQRTEEWERLSQQPNFDSVMDTLQSDAHFHEQIVALAGNPFLARMWQGLHVHLQIGRLYAGTGVVDHQSHGSPEHWSIVVALEAGDSAAAEESLRAHLEGAAERVAALAGRRSATALVSSI